MPLLQDMAQAGSLGTLASALASFLRRAAARAFAPPDPGAHLLQGALHGMLDAVRDFTSRRSAAPQVCLCQWASASSHWGMLLFPQHDTVAWDLAAGTNHALCCASQPQPRPSTMDCPSVVMVCSGAGAAAGGADFGGCGGGPRLPPPPRLLLQGAPGSPFPFCMFVVPIRVVCLAKLCRGCRGEASGHLVKHG